MEAIISEAQQKMTRAVETLKEELAGIRTGRANTSLIEGVKVDAYGSMMNLRDIASINAPDPRLLTVQPWDPSLANTIAKAILNAGLGFNPAVDGATIRVPIPPLTEERRRDFLKLVNEKTENAKVVLRNVRRDAMDAITKLEKEMGEDEVKRAQDKIQKVVDDATSQVSTLADSKSKDIMTV